VKVDITKKTAICEFKLQVNDGQATILPHPAAEGEHEKRVDGWENWIITGMPYIVKAFLAILYNREWGSLARPGQFFQG